MRSLDQLIEYYQRRERECAEEIDQLVSRYNETEYKHLQDADIKRMCASWEEHRQLARDTLSWMKTVRSMLDEKQS